MAPSPCAGAVVGMGVAVGWDIFNGKQVISRDPALLPLFPGSRGCFPAGDLPLGEGVTVLVLSFKDGKLYCAKA